MTKERLRRYGQIRREVQLLRELLDEVEARMTAPKIQQITGMPSSPSHDNDIMDRLVDRHLTLQTRYLEKMDELTAEQIAVEDAIDSLEPFEREIFRLRYIQGTRWEDICVKLNYSWPQVHRYHKAALIKLSRPDDEGGCGYGENE